MAISLIDATTATVANDTSITIAKPTGVANGDILVVFLFKDDDPAVSDPSGSWVVVDANGTTTGNDIGSHIAYKIITDAGSEGSDYTWTGDREAWVGWLLCLRGVDNDTPEDVANSYNFNENDTSPLSSGVTTVTDGAECFVFCGTDLQSNSLTVPSGTTDVESSTPVEATGISSGLAYFTQASYGATGDKEWTNVASGAESHTYMVAFRPAPAGTPVYDDQAFQYDIAELIYEDQAFQYDIAELIYEDQAFQYDIAELIYEDQAFQYDILNLLNEDFTFQYDLAELIYEDFTFQYDMDGAVYDDTTIQYDIAELIYEDQAFQYDIFATLNEDFTFQYDIAELIYEDQAFQYDIAELIYEDFTFQYDIEASGTPVYDDQAFQYDIAELINEDFTFQYDIAEFVYEDTTVQYDILNLLSADLTIQYDIDAGRAPFDPVTHGPVLGDVGTDHIKVWCRVNGPKKFVFEYVEYSGSFPGTEVESSVAEAHEDYQVQLKATGLIAKTRYQYKIKLEGYEYGPYNFWTLPDDLSEVRIIVTSDQHFVMGTDRTMFWKDLYESYDASVPHVLFTIGDMWPVYGVIDSFTRALEDPPPGGFGGDVNWFNKLVRNMPWIDLWDDWDFQGNNTSKEPNTVSGVTRALAKEAWLVNHAHPDLAVDDHETIGFVKKISNVLVVGIDARYERTLGPGSLNPEFFPYDANPELFDGVLLGDDQFDWIQKQVVQYEDQVEFLAILHGGTLIDNYTNPISVGFISRRDSTGLYYKNARNRLLKWLDTSTKFRDIMVFSGDDHRNTYWIRKTVDWKDYDVEDSSMYPQPQHVFANLVIHEFKTTCGQSAANPYVGGLGREFLSDYELLDNKWGYNYLQVGKTEHLAKLTMVLREKVYDADFYNGLIVDFHAKPPDVDEADVSTEYTQDMGT
jgi:hypothetical protein